MEEELELFSVISRQEVSSGGGSSDLALEFENDQKKLLAGTGDAVRMVILEVVKVVLN